MSFEKKVPEVRFEEFSGEWEKRSFEACFVNVPNNTLSRADLNYKTGLAKNIHYGDILIKFGEVLDASNESLPFITNNDVAKKLKHAALRNGDIIIADAAEDSIVGKCTELFNIDEQLILSGLHTIAVRPTLSFASKYLGYYLNSSSYHDQLLSLMQGTKVLSISKTAIQNTNVTFPRSSEEQAQIGNYFQKLDVLINQHKQKHDKLSSIKKAMLEKMFPKQGETIPEIRFKGFSGGWDKKPFGACFINVPNNTLSRADLNYKTGLAKNIHYGDVLIKFGEVLDAHGELLPFITNDSVANKLNNSALQDGDIIIADAAEDSTVGKCTELFNIGEQLVLSGLHTIAARPIFPFASKYLGYHLNSSSYHDQLLSLMQGTKVLSISKTAVKDTKIVFPKSLEEQAAIGNYFQKLDALINQHQQKITKLNNIKQACLSKMFV
ncbi:EcoKI restriction-modification system protein HsdS [Serratia ficaria]|uniref:restriction endonuclease subunit S n=1 Tax=Serratia ficaria TaxID=61651 RepID=UPI002182C971|nr:restriction endonuclease subunit S [Serratia ficaria]CAI2452429.1 EcoKI restriction-modification system protein HsdS [Serratia ficaria]